MDVDIAQLIREVERRPDLWDQRSLYHNNRAVVHQLWAEVAYTCGIPGDSVQHTITILCNIKSHRS